MAILDLNGLEVRLGGRLVLDGLTAQLSGRSIGLLGPNGAGKSTLINTLLGFHAPSQGTAMVFGHDIRTHSREVRGMTGYMPESDAIVANMSGIAFVKYMAELSGLPAAQALERAHEAFFYVGLGEVRYRKVGTYSLGMKQLVKLAQALVHGPKLLILDEPTNGLDPMARQRMIAVIREMRDGGKMHILLSSHLLRDVDECCDEVLILRDGRVAAVANLEAERRSNRKFIEMDTGATSATEPAVAAFDQALRAIGCETAVFSNGRMKVVMPDSVEIRDLYKAAVEHGVLVRRMNHRRDSLEDIFMNAMENREAVASGRL